MRTIILILCCIFLFSCATVNRSSPNQQSWQGKNVKNLIAELGQPVLKNVRASGNTTYTYVTRSVRVNAEPPSRTMTFAMPGGRAIGVNTPAPINSEGPALECLTTFEVNPQGIIVGVQKRGKEC